jgi:hypothetical protein
MSEKAQSQSVRRIVLPSGKTIEVVRFPASEGRSTNGLHICPGCGSELVQPIVWADAPEDRWELTLECPNCSWLDKGVYNRDEVDQLEEKLDEGLVQMLGDLQRLTHTNMADEVDRFVAALQADMILPEDF